MDADERTQVDLSPYWEADDSDFNYCDCPGPPPPPHFAIPPPPPPPSLDLCRGGSQDPSELQYCHLEPVGAEYTQATFPSLPIIVVCSSVVLVALLVASFLLWKHKKKVQNFLPCKTEPHQGHLGDMTGSNGVTYDDVLINHHPTRLPNHHRASDTRHGLTPIELLDVKCGSYGAPHLTSLGHSNFTFASPGEGKEPRSGKNKDHFNPIYEEVSGCSEEKPTSRSYDSDIEDSEAEARTVASEDEFAEDELSLAEFPRPATGEGRSGTSSLRGSTGGDLCRDVASVSSEGAGSEGAPERARGGPKGRVRQPKHTHSLERNKDGHPSEGFLAKQNYYMSKSMLGPDLGTTEPRYRPEEQQRHPFARSLGRAAAPESPRFAGRLPGALLSELNHKLVGNGGAPNRTVFTVVSPSAAGPRAHFATFHPYPNNAPAENIYASVEEEGPFTIDGSRAGRASGASPSSAKGSVPKDLPRTAEDENASYGDIRPIYDTRTVCT